MEYLRTILSRLWLLGLLLFPFLTKAQFFIPINKLDGLLKALRQAGPDTNRVNLLVKIGHIYVIKHGELTPDLDTALLLSQQAYVLSRSLNYPRGRGLSYLIAAQAYREKSQKQRGWQFVQWAIPLLTKYGTSEDRADVYIEQAAYHTVSSEGLIEQIQLYEQVVPLLEHANNPLKLADALAYLGDLYQLQSNNVAALLNLRRALALYESIGHTRLEEIYDLLGFVSSKVGDYEGGIHYGLLAMKTVEATKDSVKLTKVYSRLGITYQELNQPRKALIYFDKSLRSAQNQFGKSTIIVLATTISAILNNYNEKTMKTLHLEVAIAHLQDIVKKRPQDRNDIDCRVALATCFVNIYSKLYRQYAEAQPYCDQLEAMLQVGLGQDYHLYIHGMLIPFYVNSRQYEKARALLVANEAICIKAPYTKELSVNHLWWFRLDSARASYPTAIRHYQRFVTLNDSLINEKTKQRTALFEIQYQTREKEHKISTLQQQSKLQKSMLETTRNFSVAGAIMLLMLLGLSYNRYRLKQRSNQQLQAQQQALQDRQEEINYKNTTLQLLLTEKEWLLKEIHHRVKNNLQIVMSLLNSQASYLSDDAALSAIQESQHRVQAMALIHQKLYQSEQVARIPLSTYIQEVVTYLRDSYNLPQSIHFDLQVAPIELDVTQAVPLGLIINEAITNALKYAFPEKRAGTVRIVFQRLATVTYQLTISDDGVGLPPGYDSQRSRSLGMTLMQGFSQQLGSELSVRSDAGGVIISLRFSDEQGSSIPTSIAHSYANS